MTKSPTKTARQSATINDARVSGREPTPAYHLDDAVKGKSVTVLDVSFEEFVANDYLIAAHHPAGEGSGEEYGAAVVAGPVVAKGAE